jgi:hypothetical protein
MKPTVVEIVPCRTKGVTGYANVGRSTGLGNPYGVSSAVSAEEAVRRYRERFYREGSMIALSLQNHAKKLLARDWPNGVVRIACPCNGVFKGQPCHATVIKKYLEAQLSNEAAQSVNAAAATEGALTEQVAQNPSADAMQTGGEM